MATRPAVFGVERSLTGKSWRWRRGNMELAEGAAGLEDDIVTQLLLARGVPVDGPDARGATPLLLAVKNAHVETVRLLLAAGARAVPVDDFGLDSADYMTIVPDFYEGLIEHRRASRAFRPTAEIEAMLEVMRARHEAIRKLLAAE